MGNKYMYLISDCQVHNGIVHHPYAGSLGNAISTTDDNVSIIYMWEKLVSSHPTLFVAAEYVLSPPYKMSCYPGELVGKPVVLQSKMHHEDASYLRIESPAFHANIGGEDHHIVPVRHLGVVK